MDKILDCLVDSAKKAKQELEQQSRPKRTPREVPSTKRFPENGPLIPYFLFNNRNADQPKPQQHSREDSLKRERLLKKPMVYDDDGEEERTQMKKKCRPSNVIVIRETESGINPSLQVRGYEDEERAQTKAKFSRRRSNGIVIREPKSGKDSSHDFSGKSKYNDDDHHTGKNQCMKSPNWKPGKTENKRKLKKFAADYCGNEKARTKLEAPQLPEDVRKKIEEKALITEGKKSPELEIVLVIQKVLQVSDISRQQNRIAIPLARLENPFLTQREEQWLGERNGSHTNHMTVPIIEPSGRVRSLNLRRWNIGKNSVSYVLNGDWFEVVGLNRLGEGGTVQLWAFRIRGELHLALVVISGEEEEEEEDEDEDADDDEVVSGDDDGGMETGLGGSCSSGSDEGENGTPKSEDSESYS